MIDLTSLDDPPRARARPPPHDPTGPGFIYGVRNPDNPEGVLTIGRTYNMWSSAARSRTGRACGRIDGYPANSRWIFAMRVQNQQSAENAVKVALRKLFPQHNNSPEMFYCEAQPLFDAVRSVLRSEGQLVSDVRCFPTSLNASGHLNKDQVKRVFDGVDAADSSVDLLVKRDALREFHNFVRGPHAELDKVFKWSRGNVFGLPPALNSPEPILRRMFVLWYHNRFGDTISASDIDMLKRFVETFHARHLLPDGEHAFIVVSDTMDIDG